MPSPRPAPEPRVCAAPDCSVVFTPPRSDAKFHTKTCRQRAGRARKATEAQAAEETKTGTDAEHGLVIAVRTELEKADVLNTVAGQLALQFARRIVDPSESGLTNMSKELRALMAEAKGAAAPAPDGPTPASADEDDEVTRARRRKEEIEAAAAAGADG